MLYADVSEHSVPSS